MLRHRHGMFTRTPLLTTGDGRLLCDSSPLGAARVRVHSAISGPVHQGGSAGRSSGDRPSPQPCHSAGAHSQFSEVRKPMSQESLLFLSRPAVRACLDKLDPVEVAADVLRIQAAGRAEIPAEGYLPWTNGDGAYSRAIAMLGALHREEGPVYGMKLINAAVNNPSKGIERAGGLSFVFDPETARPKLMAEAGYLSAVRTAAYTMVSLRTVGPQTWDGITLIGTGALARAHLDLLVGAFPEVRTVVVFDLSAARAAELVAWAREEHPQLEVTVAATAAEAIAATPVTVTLTTSSEPYLRAALFAPGSFVAHVSLGDLTEEVFLGAQAVYGDDLDLIEENPRRILGSLLQEGKVTRPGTEGAPGRGAGRSVEGTLGQVLLGQVPAIRPTDGYVVSNPFGMSILDVGLIDAVHRTALELGVGQRLDLL
ncbi:ornithine cyclodeaminase [Streptomyces venezuelae]|uniref:Ornithine cyclodeaminase n=2 Tax=Streptomyces venezuelae TaxID=54571 RepID=A0A5P2DSG6_STRVZ|nr:ornithine cyclodeaminase [Streptomyces venezuelae]